MNTEDFPKVGEIWQSNIILNFGFHRSIIVAEIIEISDTEITMLFCNGKYNYNYIKFLKNFKKVESETNEIKKTSIENPSYYQQGKIQVWDFIIDQNLTYLEGCIIKYVCRYKKKNGVEDLQKAKVYLEKLIEIESKK